jgi:hypothetical protein
MHGALAGMLALASLGAASLPSRLRSAPASLDEVGRAFSGALLDLSGAVVLLVMLVLLAAVGAPLALARLRTAAWQTRGPVLVTAPLGLLLWLVTVAAQEVRMERGAFPTAFDLAEAGSSTAFLTGALGFLVYARIWAPALLGLALFGGILVLSRPRERTPLPWLPWSAGLALGLLAGTGLVLGASSALAFAPRYSVGAVGAPVAGLVESAFDVLVRRGPGTPRGLVLDAELPDSFVALGAARLGWPPPGQGARRPCHPHPYARPLDTTAEPATRDPRGRALVQALERASAALMPPDAAPLALVLVSLEGFRGDDLHALNTRAPGAIAPFVTSLYDGTWRGGRALTSRSTYQAGVRTAHALGALTCGLGTLPYSLALIRDLQPFPVRCASDVLRDAGFRGSFFYGSDARFDEMDRFVAAHGFDTIVSQADFPKGTPTGTWDAVTDFAVFDAAARHIASELERGASQFSLVLSLSNHSPFTPPADLPPEVAARVDEALATSTHFARPSDRRRLHAYSYTDAAVERLLGQLEASGAADRALVVLVADHSTGHDFVWGPEEQPRLTDEMKGQVPFAVLVPEGLLARATDRAGAEAALAAAQALLDAGPLSQNDVPRLLLALASAHPGVRALPEPARWHSLGGQLTSPWFDAGEPAGAVIMGINGVAELFALDAQGRRVGEYEASIFLRTRADRYRVTPRLIPVTATLRDVMRRAVTCPDGG